MKCNWEDSFGQLLEATASKFETSTVQKVLILKNDRFVESHEVPIDAPVFLCQQFGCKFVLC